MISGALFLMQCACVVGTIILYVKMSYTLMRGGNRTSLFEDPKENVRQSLISSNDQNAIGIYDKIKIRFHSFFLLMTACMITRVVFYVNLRLETQDEIENIDSWEPISPTHNLQMGIEEFFMNILLLC